MVFPPFKNINNWPHPPGVSPPPGSPAPTSLRGGASGEPMPKSRDASRVGGNHSGRRAPERLTVTGRVLELRPDCLERPNRLDVETVEATMLWPDDKDRQFRDALHARHQIKVGELLSEDLESVAQSLDVLPRYTDIKKDVKDRRFKSGRIAGLRLYILVKTNLEGDIKLGIKEVDRRLQKSFKISATQIKRIWREFQPVAHLWAAVVYRAFHDQENKTFPCKAKNLAEFLALAEWFADLGTSIKPAQSPSGTILQAEKSIRVPCGLMLPTVRWPADQIN
jgi:hypothetical protein